MHAPDRQHTTQRPPKQPAIGVRRHPSLSLRLGSRSAPICECDTISRVHALGAPMWTAIAAVRCRRWDRPAMTSTRQPQGHHDCRAIVQDVEPPSRHVRGQVTAVGPQERSPSHHGANGSPPFPRPSRGPWAAGGSSQPTVDTRPIAYLGQRRPWPDLGRVSFTCLSGPIRKSVGIRTALHPRSRRCASLTYEPCGYAHSAAPCEQGAVPPSIRNDISGRDHLGRQNCPQCASAVEPRARGRPARGLPPLDRRLTP